MIKDYLIHREPGKKQSILSALLGTCISEHVDDPRIKECARRAAWLGNDESHYLRKWEGRDVDDLKTLIDLTVHWMLMQPLTDRYNDEMEASNEKAGGVNK